jgi:phage shock protein E
MPFPTDYDTRAAEFDFAKPGEVKKAMEDPATMLLDVRSAKEVEANPMNGGHKVITPYTHQGDALDQAVKDHGKDKTIVAFCAIGKRSMFSKKHLEELGYKKVLNAGGLDDLIACLE